VALASLTFKEIKARPVICKLARPAVARIGAMTHLLIILIDLFTEEGVVGGSYFKPYLPKAMKYLIPALLDFREMLKGRRVSPVDLYETARKSLHFVGYQGLSMIAVAGLDMAAWDALAKAADVPLCVLLGGSVGPVNAYNSKVAAVAGIRGGRTARREGRRVPSPQASAGPRRST
jgi:mandelate racemase